MATIRDCKKIQPLLSEYVDGVLNEQDAWDVQMHLSSCAVCDKIARDFTATARLLQAAPTPQLSANFEAMLARRIADESLRPLPLNPWQKFVLAFQDGWKQPRVRQTFATGAALAFLGPLGFFALQPGAQQVTRNTPATPAAASPAPEATSLDDLWREHRTYESSEPLSNPSGLLPVTMVDNRNY